jgi:ABC-2 type transport system permease protein
MKVLWIGLTDLRRMFRVRTNIFFVFVFPMVLILVLGATFGGSFTPRLGVVSSGSGPLGAALATPTSPATVIAGTTLGRVLIAFVQALVIILGSALIFTVSWGQPAGVAAVVILYALVGAGAGIFVGTLFRNEQQAIGVSLLLGLGLGALGGCMVPLEVFSPTMRRVAHLTPQAWGNDAFARLVGHGASIAGILPQLGILAAYAAVLLTLAAWRLRRVLFA